MTTTPPTALATFHAPSGSDLDTWYEILLALTGQWPTFVPTLTGAGGNPGVSSATGGYIQLGKFVVFHMAFVLTSGGTGLYSASLPVASNEGTGSPIGVATLNDASVSTNRFFRSAYQNGSTSIAFGAEDSTRVDPTHPFVFASGDSIAVKGWYEGA